MTINIIQEEKKQFICDWCKKEYIIEAVNMEFWYGSKLDLLATNFCSDECCYHWVINELCPIDPSEETKHL